MKILFETKCILFIILKASNYKKEPFSCYLAFNPIVNIINIIILRYLILIYSNCLNFIKHALNHFTLKIAKTVHKIVIFFNHVFENFWLEQFSVQFRTINYGLLLKRNSKIFSKNRSTLSRSESLCTYIFYLL